MTSDEFRAELRRLGLRQNKLAEDLGVDKTTVNAWAVGRHPVPQYAVFVLSLLDKLAGRNA